MTTSTPPPDGEYHEVSDYAWTEKAFDMLEQGQLHALVVSHDGVVRSRVWGPCPGCGDDLDDQQTHTAVTNLMGDTRTSTRGTGQPSSDTNWFPVDVTCRCARTHPKTPSGATGCGVSFRVEVPVTGDRP